MNIENYKINNQHIIFFPNLIIKKSYHLISDGNANSIVRELEEGKTIFE